MAFDFKGFDACMTELAAKVKEASANVRSLEDYARDLEARVAELENERDNQAMKGTGNINSGYVTVKDAGDYDRAVELWCQYALRQRDGSDIPVNMPWGLGKSLAHAFPRHMKPQGNYGRSLFRYGKVIQDACVTYNADMADRILVEDEGETDSAILSVGVGALHKYAVRVRRNGDHYTMSLTWDLRDESCFPPGLTEFLTQVARKNAKS